MILTLTHSRYLWNEKCPCVLMKIHGIKTLEHIKTFLPSLSKLKSELLFIKKSCEGWKYLKVWSKFRTHALWLDTVGFTTHTATAGQWASSFYLDLYIW